MTDIFDEVEQDLRRERLTKVWDRYGIYVIVVAVLIVVVTAGWRGYEWWRVNSERSAGEEYAAVLQSLEADGAAADPAALTGFAADAPEGFAILARFRAATVQDDTGESEAAAATLRSIVDDGKVPGLYRDMARVRLAQVLIDAGDFAAAQDAVRGLAEDNGNAYNRSATEMMGLAAYAQDDLEDASRWFTALSTSANVGQTMRQRAQTMLTLIERVSAQEKATAEAAAAFEAQETATTETEDTSATETEAATATGENPAGDAAASDATGGASAFPMPSGDALPSGTIGTGSAFPMPTGSTASDPADVTAPADPAASGTDATAPATASGAEADQQTEDTN